VPAVTAASGAFGLFVAFGWRQVGSLFSADAWNNIGFTAAEVRTRSATWRSPWLSAPLLLITLYCLANLAYLCTLPLVQIQTAPDDRVASAALNAIFGPTGAMIMAVAIIISTFGCNNGLNSGRCASFVCHGKGWAFLQIHGALNKEWRTRLGADVSRVWITILILLRTRKVSAAGVSDLRQCLQQSARLRRPSPRCSSTF